MLLMVRIVLLAALLPVAPSRLVSAETRETPAAAVFAAEAAPRTERLSTASETREATDAEVTEDTPRLPYILAALFGFGLGVMALGRMKKASPPGRGKKPGV